MAVQEMIYGLMDVESANLVGTYESEEAALAVVRAAIRAHRETAIPPLALGYEDDAGSGALIEEGADGLEPARKGDPGKFTHPA